MIYKRFSKKVGNMMDVPTKEQQERLVEGDDTIHLSVPIGYLLQNGNQVHRDIVPQGKHFIAALDLLRVRGAVRGTDYLISCYGSKLDSYIIMTLHTTRAFLSDEDFDSSLERA